MFILSCCIIPCHRGRQQSVCIHTSPPDGSVQRISIQQAALQDVYFHALPPGLTGSAAASATRDLQHRDLMDAVRRSSNVAVPPESPGSRGRGRPRKTWRECVKRDILECSLLDTDPLNRAVWRAGVNANRLLPTPVAADDAAV